MTGAEVAGLISLAKSLGIWPSWVAIAFITMGPWAAFYFLSRAQEKRFNKQEKMYDDNVELVRHYQKLADDQHHLIAEVSATMGNLNTILSNINQVVLQQPGKLCRNQKGE